VDTEHAGALSAQWGFEVPSQAGLTAPEMIDAAAAGELDVLWCDGSNLLEVLPDAHAVAEAFGRVGLRVHSDIVLTKQMFVEGDDVILLPMATRYEQEGGGTSTTTERQIAFSPHVVDPPGEARSEWRVFADVAQRVRPDLAPAFSWPTNKDLRTEIARIIPRYAGIEHLTKTGDAVQYGGRHLCAGGQFPTPSGRGHFSPVDVRPQALGPDQFFCSSRRGRQFNTMVFSATDPLTGAGRDAVYLDEVDARRLSLADGDRVRLRSGHGTFDGTAKVVRLAARSVQVHWPEANALIDPSVRERHSKVPDYNAIVTLERLGGPR
jgi:predicted molibdopterin-dependent oxidoreductase YjgC